MAARFLVAFATALACVAATAAPTIDRWQFRVLLDDKEIGFHHYELVQDGDIRRMNSRAEFDIKFLFFTAFRYRHSLSSEWQGDCLSALSTETLTNGKEESLEGSLQQNSFVVQAGGEPVELPACVMNFAYWDPQILEQERLLNPQTGEYLDVNVEIRDPATVDIDGVQVEADTYRITAKDMRIDLWYADDDKEWLALESLVEGGRIIRYERIRT